TGQDELRTGQDELRTGQDELRTGQDELRTGQDELRTGQDELRREVTDLRTGQDELRREVTDLRTGQDELRREVTDLRTGQDELRREVTDLRTGQDELRSGQDELRSGQEGLRHEVADLRTLIDERTEMLRKEFNNAVATLGQRWGMMSEDILRQVVAAVIEKSYGGTVRQVQIEDEEYDVVITNGSHILVEITARARQDVLRRLERKRKTYTEHTGIEPGRVILATAQIHISVARKLEQMGIEVIQPDVLIEGDTI
ncbi:MAG: DUF3782 domain-containing protein, partial [Caldilineales bacterium]|nr:DUF3782 domain-containing protein [Caldilineales bacterium]